MTTHIYKISSQRKRENTEETGRNRSPPTSYSATAFKDIVIHSGDTSGRLARGLTALAWEKPLVRAQGERYLPIQVRCAHALVNAICRWIETF